MRRKVQLSSLTVGRCFTVPSDADGAAESGEKATIARSVMAAHNVWKITDCGSEVTAVNAKGETMSFDPAFEATEIPRQGYDRMVQRG